MATPRSVDRGVVASAETRYTTNRGLRPRCASGRIRTCDTWYRKPVLYPLSYGGLQEPEDYRRISLRMKPVPVATLAR
jgi:hypothetical protein